MITSKQMKYFGSCLVLATSLVLWNPLLGSALAQHGGGAAMQGGMPGGITMQEVSGKVVETMDSGGYTYALVEKEDAKTWVAMPITKIAVGDEIACRSGMVMNNFKSSSLQRVFDHIVFSGGLTATSATASASEDIPVQDEETDVPEKPKAPEDWKNF